MITPVYLKRRTHGDKALAIKTLKNDDAVDLLSKSPIGRLGCVADGEPYVVPINYLYENGSIYSHSLPGRKLNALRSNSRACLQVDDVGEGFGWRSVIAYGWFEEIEAPAERRAVFVKLISRFPLLTPVESLIAQDAAAPESVIYRIRVDRITGVTEV